VGRLRFQRCSVVRQIETKPEVVAARAVRAPRRSAPPPPGARARLNACSRGGGMGRSVRLVLPRSRFSILVARGPFVRDLPAPARSARSSARGRPARIATAHRDAGAGANATGAQSAVCLSVPERVLTPQTRRPLPAVASCAVPSLIMSCGNDHWECTFSYIIASSRVARTCRRFVRTRPIVRRTSPLDTDIPLIVRIRAARGRSKWRIAARGTSITGPRRVLLGARAAGRGPGVGGGAGGEAGERLTPRHGPL